MKVREVPKRKLQEVVEQLKEYIEALTENCLSQSAYFLAYLKIIYF